MQIKYFKHLFVHLFAIDVSDLMSVCLHLWLPILTFPVEFREVFRYSQCELFVSYKVCKYILPLRPEAMKVYLIFSFKSHMLRSHTYICYAVCIDFCTWNAAWIKVHLFSFLELVVGKLRFLLVMDLLLCQESVTRVSWRLFQDSSFLPTDWLHLSSLQQMLSYAPALSTRKSGLLTLQNLSLLTIPTDSNP